MNNRIRQCSPIGAYHVCVRAHGREYIFKDEAVAVKFIDRMKIAFENYDVKLPAWTVMSNHAHMVVEGDIERIARAFQSLGGSFCRWFNRYTGGRGAVFDSRYYLTPISDRNQYINCLAYVFNNPVRAKIADRAEDYKWSNYADIAEFNFETGDNKLLVLRDLVEDLKERVTLATKSSDFAIDPLPIKAASDKDLTNTLKDSFPEYSANLLQEDRCETEKMIVRKLLAIHSTDDSRTNAHQIARISKISYLRVRRIIADEFVDPQ